MSVISQPAPYLIPDRAFAQITDIRVQQPERSLQLARKRKRRTTLTPDGKLNILACDHPARRVNHIGTELLRMANRQEYLSRMVSLLQGDAVDGIMASMDILEELLLLQDILKDRFLDDKVLIASLNRGGLADVSWEMDDPVTGATPQSCITWHLDGAKLLLRLCDEEPASLKTLQACAEAINQLNDLQLPCFLEPLPVIKTSDGYQVDKRVDALTRIVGVASALGNSSRYLWLKLPACEDLATVARATTLPILLLGGEASGNAEHTLDWVQSAMQAAPNIRGVMLGRNMLYPGDMAPLAFALNVDQIIHS